MIDPTLQNIEAPVQRLRVLLVEPKYGYREALTWIPIGKGYLATQARRLGHEVRIVDNALRPGTTDEQLSQAISDFRPDVVGTGGMSLQWSDSKRIARIVRQAAPEALLIGGGVHLTALPEDGLDTFDLVAVGEGEITFREVVKRYNEVHSRDPGLYADIAGIWLKKSDGTVVSNPRREFVQDMDSLGWPSYDLLEVPLYHDHLVMGERGVSIMTGRGCPFDCFAGDTKIITSKGSNKRASEVVVGDCLVALDERTNALAETEVTHIYSREVNELVRVSFEDGRTLDVTDEHPFYTKGEWVRVKDLKAGDEIYDITSRDKISLNKRLYNPAKRQDVRVQISETVGNKRHREGTFNYDHLRGPRAPWSKEDPRREHNRDRMIHDNPMYDPVVAKRVGNTLRAHITSGEVVPFMRRPEYWKKVRLSPNKQERQFLGLLQEEFGGRYRFVGDGSKKIEWYCPDFIDEEHKKIVEYNRCWWHGCPTHHPGKDGIQRRDAHRLEVFRKNGYKTHVVWSCELQVDREGVLSGLRSFTWNGARVKQIETIVGKRRVYNYSCSPHQNYFANYALSHNCSFCASPLITLRKMRYFSDAFIYDQMQMLERTYGFTNFRIMDDTFAASRNRVRKFCTGLRERGLRYNFNCLTHVNTSDQRMFDDMASAGFSVVAFGIESANDAVLKIINKGTTKAKAAEALRQSRSVGLIPEALFMIGNVGDTRESVVETVEFAKEHNSPFVDGIRKGFNWFQFATPFPGSKFYHTAKDHGTILSHNFDDYSHQAPVYIPSSLTYEFMIRMRELGIKGEGINPHQVQVNSLHWD